MTQHNTHIPSALRFYALLLRLYPRQYRQTFGAQMLQTFQDQYQ